MKLFGILFIFYFSIGYAQKSSDSTFEKKTYLIYKANTLSTHPLAIFMSRMAPNFQTKTVSKISLQLNFSQGNVWLPYVKAYIPINESDRQKMKSISWHTRAYAFDTLHSPYKTMTFEADGIIRLFQPEIQIPINSKNQIDFGLHMFVLGKGKVPTALITSDNFLEWFHSNIAGGEDPFARKYYGLNKAKIVYKDSENRQFILSAGDFMLTGITVKHTYLPSSAFLKKHRIFITTAAQLGWNTTKINPSIDLGLGISILKKIKLSPSKTIFAGANSSILAPKIWHFGSGVLLSDRHLLYQQEIAIHYQKRITANKFFSISTTYTIQSAYNRPQDFDYMVLTGQRVTPHWHLTISHLYSTLTANNLIFTFKKNKITYWFYIREDFLVDNAPDIQVGYGVNFKL